MKCQGYGFTIHCLFVDDMMHVPTCDAVNLSQARIHGEIRQGFRYYRALSFMETYSGMQVEQSRGKIRLHVNNYIRENLDEFKAFRTKSVRPKLVPIQPGLVLEKEDCPIRPDPRKKFYQSFVAKL